MTPPAGAASADGRRVIAVVVTWNRRELLQRVIAALHAQTRPVDVILILDNASTDGTTELLCTARPGVTPAFLRENIGGAGGFALGLSWALESAADYVWLMDDDALPAPDCLEALLDAVAAAPHVPFVCPVVQDAAGRTDTHVVPSPSIAASYAAAEAGQVALSACSFVGPLISARHARATHAPLSDFFIWHDDTEYTARLARETAGRGVPVARITHLAQNQGTGAFVPDRARRNIRNLLWGARESRTSAISGRQWLEYLRVAAVRQTRDAGFRHGLAAAWALVGGVADGILRTPTRDAPSDLLRSGARRHDLPPVDPGTPHRDSRSQP